MYSPSLEQVLYIHERLIATSGGSPGVKDAGRLQAALAQPFATYDGKDLYPGVLPKAVALAYFLIQGHPFHDGNKRIGYAAMLVMLKQNGYRLAADVDDAEQVVLGVASSQVSHAEAARRANWDAQHGPAHLRTGRFFISELHEAHTSKSSAAVADADEQRNAS